HTTAVLGLGPLNGGRMKVTFRGVLPAKSYLLARTNSRSEIFKALAAENNAAPSAKTFHMDLPSLPIGSTVNGQLAASGNALFYKVSTPAGADLTVNFTCPSNASHEVYIPFGGLPSRQEFCGTSNRSGNPKQACST